MVRWSENSHQVKIQVKTIRYVLQAQNSSIKPLKSLHCFTFQKEVCISCNYRHNTHKVPCLPAARRQEPAERQCS